jgi:hypothetical protein
MINNKKNSDEIQDALNDCIESMIIENKSVESCLSQHAQYEEELRPLVDVVKTTRAACSFSPAPAFRARARYEFHRALNDSFTQPVVSGFSWRWSWATVISSLGVFLITSTGGAVAASASSMPGHPLYQLKRSVENIQLTMSPSKAVEARFYATLADRTVSEIVYAAQSGDAQLTEKLTAELANSLNMISVNMEPSRTLNYGEDTTKGGTFSTSNEAAEQFPSNPDTTAPSFTPSIAAVPPPQTNIAQDTSVAMPALTIPQATVTLSGIDDPILLKLLQQYSVKNIAELLAALDEVQPSVREALLAAIETAAAGYSQILGE